MKDLDFRCKSGSFSDLKRPDECSCFIELCSRIKKAIETKEKTIIYGDYDVDGLTSTAILKLCLDELGLYPGFFIPSRYKEGYGLNESRVEEFYQKGYHLIIAVDNGVNQIQAIEKAKSLGMDILVIDHHEIGDVKPKYDCLFHHIDSGFISYNCSAASLSYFVASYLLKRDDPYFAFLAGVAVFSDVMPLVGNNLIFAKMMKDIINRYPFENIMLLLPKSVDYDDINFTLIPSLNSIGRICEDSLSTNQACRFLLRNEFSLDKMVQFSTLIKQTNEKRKAMVKNLKINSSDQLSSQHAMVMKLDCLSGLSGLIANKYLRDENKCVAVCLESEKDKDCLVCSFRVLDGYSLDSFFKRYEYLFLLHGGHEKACGATIKKEKYYQVATMFISECEKMALEMKKVEQKYIDITLDDLNFENYKIYEKFMPFGENFSKPRFRVFFPKNKIVFSSTLNYAWIENECHVGRVLFFKDIEKLKNIEDDFISIEGYLRKNTFRNKTYIEIITEKII